VTAREAILRELAHSKEADPHVIARRLLPRLTADQREELLIQGLEELTKLEIIATRQAIRASEVRPRGLSRWRVAMPERVWVGEWKLLENCKLDDLRWLADDYRARSEQMAAKEREFRLLAEDLEVSGCATVGEMWARTGQESAA
jgi:hypothetical protein